MERGSKRRGGGRQWRFSWFKGLEGSTPYEKLKDLRKGFLDTMRITERSKKWWDTELSEQLRMTREARRGKGNNCGLTQKERLIRWKAEKEKLRGLVRMKKKEC